MKMEYQKKAQASGGKMYFGAEKKSKWGDRGKFLTRSGACSRSNSAGWANMFSVRKKEGNAGLGKRVREEGARGVC